MHPALPHNVRHLSCFSAWELPEQSSHGVLLERFRHIDWDMLGLNIGHTRNDPKKHALNGEVDAHLRHLGLFSFFRSGNGSFSMNSQVVKYHQRVLKLSHKVVFTLFSWISLTKGKIDR